MDDISAPSSTLQYIPIDKIYVSQYQARKNFNEETLQELSESIKEKGLIQPLTVRLIENGYELIAGERRLRAVKALGWTMVEAKVFNTRTEQDAAILGLIENLQREDLNPIEEAAGFAQLSKMDMTQEEIAKVIGKGRVYVNQTIRLLELSAEIQDAVSRGTLSRSHAEELLRLPNQELQLQVAQKIPGHLTVEQTRRLVDFMSGINRSTEGKKKKASKSRDPLELTWTRLLHNEEINKYGKWGVRFNRNNRWVFEIDSHDEMPLETLREWFNNMSNELSKNDISNDNREVENSSIKNKEESIKYIESNETDALLTGQLSKGNIL